MYDKVDFGLKVTLGSLYHMDGLSNLVEGHSLACQPFYLAFTGPGTVLNNFFVIDIVRKHLFPAKILHDWAGRAGLRFWF